MGVRFRVVVFALLLGCGSVSSHAAPRLQSADLAVDAPSEECACGEDVETMAMALEPPPPLIELPPSAPVPETLPVGLREGLADLLELGIPDPRHGTFYELEIVDDTNPSPWWSSPEPLDGGNATRRAFGFLLPPTSSGEQLAIVDLQLYPVVSAVAPVDLRQSCEATLATLAALVPPPPNAPHDQYWRELEAAWGRCPPVAAPLVLADAHPALALRVAGFDVDAERALPWHVGIAEYVLVRSYRRAVHAHERGDDRIARHAAHLALHLRDRTDRAYYEAGLVRSRGWHFPDVASMRVLALDQDRRARRGARDPLPALTDAGEVPPDRVPLLIEHLDEVRGAMGMSLSTPVVDALVRAGDPAVERLIDVVEHDSRLTRTALRAGPGTLARFVSVRSTAFRALERILGLQPGDFAAWPDAAPGELAASLRRYWARYGRHPPRERAYRILADDDGREHHVSAAMRLSASEARDPTVTRLIVRRLNESDIGAQCAFAIALWQYSPEQAPALLQAYGRRCLEAPRCACASLVLSVVGHRDPVLVELYARQVRAEPFRGDLLQPLAQFPPHPATRSLVRWLFTSGPFAPARIAGGGGRNAVSNLVDAGLFDAHVVRDELAAALRNTARAGTLEVRQGEPIVSRGGRSFGVRVHALPREPQTVRIADLWADLLAERLGVDFSLAWAEEPRDRAIAEMRTRLAPSARSEAAARSPATSRFRSGQRQPR